MKDFSSALMQAMQFQGNPSVRDLQRQALADLGARTQSDQASSDGDQSPADATPRAKTDNAPRSAGSTTSASSTASASDVTSANQELAQRARRVSMLRASPGHGNVSEKTAVESRSRKVSARKADPHDEAASPQAAQVSQHAVQTRTAMAATPTTQASPAQDADVAARLAAGADQATSAPVDATSALTEATGAGQTPSGLTTLNLSPHLNILTPAHGVVNEQSLQAFAQSMGIDASQFKQLMDPNAALANASGARAGVTASDAQLSSLLPAMQTAEGKVIDLSQALPEGMSLQDLQIDLLGAAPRRGSLDTSSPSTLDVLGMREGNLTLDAVNGLQDAAQTGTGEHSADQGGAMAQGSSGAVMHNEAASASNAAQPAARSMTEHFEKLSAKLATEMAARIHEQFSQGEWKMKFALKPASLGQVDVQLEMRDGKLAAVFQADNPMTQDLLQNGSQRLRDALSQMGLSQSSVWVGDGRGQASQQGDRHAGNAQGDGAAMSQRQAASQEPVQTVSAPRRDSLSQLDFYA